jgi:prepilin-type N-terminal cleavage/methylation domain-containing protein
MKTNTRAFTLIEIAVVISVIGILFTIVASSNYLLRNYKLKSIMEDVIKLNIAFTNFKTIYKALPGDYSIATSRFSTTQNGISVQNGNGNDYIDNDSNEAVAALQHLSLAGLTAGEYRGTWTISSNVDVVMPARYGNSTGYYFGSTTATAGATPTVFDDTSASRYNSLVIFARIYDTSANGTIASASEAILPALNPGDMLQLDTIYDDGLPRSGLILAANGSGASANSCVNTGTTPNSYATNSRTLTCYFGVVLDKNAM